MLEIAAFASGTIVLLYISQAALRLPGSHGFHRFIAWELMLVLVVYNLDGWYSAPPTWDQVVCGMLMALSLLLAIVGYLTLRQFGQPDGSRNDATLLEFERTTQLVTQGIFGHIRHPMYSSLIMLDWGLFFKKMSLFSGSTALLACLFLIIASLVEERENTRYFGERYREYMKASKRYLPWLL